MATKRRFGIVVLTSVAIFSSACAPPQSPSVEPSFDDDTSAPAPAGPTAAGGNHTIRRFEEAKHELARIYMGPSPHADLYCGCAFFFNAAHHATVDTEGCGYIAAQDRARAERIEWEHAVPASAFGRTFAAWREGDPRCVDRRGKPFRGRRCARIASAEFARMEADLHNLFPVVGEVNALRSDLPMGLPDAAHGDALSRTFRFGRCESSIERGVFYPRPQVRGDVARAYKYMDRSYPGHHLIDDAHRALFDAWDRADPPDAWERERNRRIAARQGNANELIGDAVSR